MRLSIIIPAYNAEPYIDSLINRLKPQITEEIEVIVVDDGSSSPYLPPYEWVKVVRQDNGGVSSARNKGLDLAKGEYIAFIDADDMVTEDYIEQIFAVLDGKPDYVYLSWETIGRGWQARVILRTVEDEFPPDNLCVWNRIYKRKLIGKTRFNTAKKVAEDAEFIRLVELTGKKKAFISKPIYLYRSDTPNSLSKRFKAGQLDTARVVYYIPHVTAEMDLLDEFIEADKTAEVILMTEKNEQPELKRYAMVIPPRQITATEARGEYTPLIRLLPKPIKTQIVLWTSFAQEIGGIETFTYAFCKQMSKYYDIVCLYDTMDPRQIERVSRFCECRKNDGRTISCEFLVVNRIIDKLPENVRAKKVVQMVHGARINYADVPTDRDIIVTVSEYVKQTWTDRTKNARVIHNIMPGDKPKDKPLLLVTASRLGARDKGLERMIKLGNLMDAQGINYAWLIFTEAQLPRNASLGMVKMRPTLDILPWIQKADYLVQLSDEEAFCYSLAEALSVGTPVIVTPLGINEELGIEDGTNAHVVPFEIPNDFDVSVFQKVPKFKWPYDNGEVIDAWRDLFGPMEPTHSYKPEDLVTLEATITYYDTQLGREVHAQEKIRVSAERASQIVGAGYGRKI